MRIIAIVTLITLQLVQVSPGETNVIKPLIEQRAHDDKSFLSIHGQRAYNDACFFISGYLKEELRAQETSAFNAYMYSSPEVAAWALEELIKSYARSGVIMQELQSGWVEGNKGNKFFAHARLFKIYTSMNDDKQAQRHLTESIRLRDGDMSEDFIIKLLDKMDQIQLDGEHAPPEGRGEAPRP